MEALKVIGSILVTLLVIVWAITRLMALEDWIDRFYAWRTARRIRARDPEAYDRRAAEVAAQEDDDE